MRLRTLDDVDVAGKRVLLRADLNVPLADGRIADDFRIRQSLPTIKALLERDAARIVICSHLGRPKGAPDPKFSLQPVAERLAALLRQDVPLAPTPEDAGDVSVMMLENVRFFPGETKNDPAFAAQLAALADVYVNDAFGAVHRAHASVVGVTSLLPSAAGLLLQKEVEVLARALESPERPLVAAIGGAKVSDKLGVIDNLLRVADRLLVGGAMCFTFLRARGLSVGRSLVEEDRVEDVKPFLSEKLVLPTDVVVASAMEAGAGAREVSVEEIPSDMAGYDIGTATRRAYVDEVRAARTVVWNGPMGVFEIDDFAAGTRAVAAAVAKGDAYSIVGGGDSVAALEKFGTINGVDHVSTGGGAMLEFLEGKMLPGLAPLLV